jgi:alpha-amylase/alpha-mannosidase (GH57 family)
MSISDSLGLCVHAHFYQPTREDPLTGKIPQEPGAAPYHDWNEKIYDHCYRPNAELGVFERVSFNIGPTLFDWMAENHPETSQQIIAQARANLERYGVTNALAQPYHHTILPLGSYQDKVTQVRWGIADFELRFGFKPQGMWLPEAGVDLETLAVLADCGIQFTILAPWQAAAAGLDVTQPYRVVLPQGKEITVVFYQAELSSNVSFNPQATINADDFAHNLLRNELYPRLGETSLLTIASDGELYGHHQPFRDRFLARLTDGALNGTPLQATFPALWLKDHPATQTVAIRENTSWSCHHGVARWSTGCDCTPYSGWKKPFFAAMQWLGGEIDRIFLQMTDGLVRDPWELRHQYIQVVLGQAKVEDLLQAHAIAPLEADQLRSLDLILKAQFERQRMFTSCGWFFEDFDRIEPRNNVAYAAQAAWWALLASGEDLTGGMLDRLHAVTSWRSGLCADIIFVRQFRKTSQYYKDWALLKRTLPQWSSEPCTD